MSAPGNTPPKTYEERKLSGLCTDCGKPAEADSQLCRKHRRMRARSDRASKQRRRLERRMAGKCAFCPAKSKTYRCLACTVKWNEQRGRVCCSVDSWAERLDRIRARTVLEADGRTRYRGQLRRGRQTIDDLDEQDFDLAVSYLLKAKDGLRLARTAEAKQLPRIQRREAEHAAISFADIAARFVGEVCDRNRYERLPAVAGDEDEGDEVGDFDDLRRLVAKSTKAKE